MSNDLNRLRGIPGAIAGAAAAESSPVSVSAKNRKRAACSEETKTKIGKANSGKSPSTDTRKKCQMQQRSELLHKRHEKNLGFQLQTIGKVKKNV